MKGGPHLPQLEKALAWNEDPTQPKINKLKKKNPSLYFKKKKKKVFMTTLSIRAENYQQLKHLSIGEPDIQIVPYSYNGIYKTIKKKNYYTCNIVESQSERRL